MEQVGSQGCEEMDEMIDALTKALPLIAAILYMIVAVGYGNLSRREQDIGFLNSLH